MTTPPPVSIFVPVITAEDAGNLKDLLLSISNQTFAEFRVHICDDTPGQMAEPASRLAAADGRFMYRPNRRPLGAVATYRRGFFLGLTGEYIVRAKAGHRWERDYLRQNLETPRANPQAAGAYGQARDVSSGELFDDEFDGENPDPQRRCLSALRSDQRSLPYGLFRSALAAPFNQYIEYGYDWPGGEGGNSPFTSIFDAMLVFSLALQYPLVKNGGACLAMDFQRFDCFVDQWGLINHGLTPCGFYFPIVLLDMAVRFAEGQARNDLIAPIIREMAAGQYRGRFQQALQLVRRLADDGLFQEEADGRPGLSWAFGRFPLQDFFLLHYLEVRLTTVRAYLPELPDIHSALASVLLRKGRVHESLTATEKELAKNPLSPWALSLKNRLADTCIPEVN